jgi:hypothetical protein
MKKIVIFLIICILNTVFACGGGGSSGVTNPGENPGNQRIKKVTAINRDGSKKMPSIFKSMLKLSSPAEIDLSNPGEYIATYNDIEGSDDYGKIVRIDKMNGTYIVEYYTYEYSIYDKDGTDQPLTVKTWKSNTNVTVQVTKFYYNTAATNSTQKFIDVVEYNSDGVTPASYVRYRYAFENDAFRLTSIQQFNTGDFDPVNMIGTSATNAAYYTYYDNSNNLYSIQYDQNSVTTYKYYTQPVIVAESTVVTEVETTIEITNADTPEEITAVNNYETDVDGLFVTVKVNTGDTVDVPLSPDGTGNQDIPTEATTPIIIDYDYVYETGDSTNNNWFDAFYKEFYPFAD